MPATHAARASTRSTGRRLGRAAAALALAIACGGALAQPAPERTTLQRRADSVATLIETSSGARQVDASAVPAALARRDAARDTHRAARAALERGDDAGASRLLDDASRLMVEAVRLAAPEQVTAEQDGHAFTARMESTRALVDAQARIAGEKGASASQRSAETVRAQLASADAAWRAGRRVEARAQLDQAYLTAKAGVSTLRGGDTLVRSLAFASKEEEYAYEIDRNATHTMLIDLLLREKRGTAGVDAMVQQSLATAARLRREAEASAARRDWDAGIRLLEDATRELVRAIRGAGVYIPG